MHQRRGPLVAAWLYISPILVILLAIYGYLYTKPPGADKIINPYVCTPKSSLASVKEMCKVGKGNLEFENVSIIVFDYTGKEPILTLSLPPL